MKRFLLAFLTLTIALASVCWANEIVGIWKFEDLDVKVENEEDAQTFKDIYSKNEKYFSFTEDGRASITNVVDNQFDYKIGTWIQLTPEHYLFSYSFYYDALKKEMEIENILSIVDGSLRRKQIDTEDTYIYEVYEKIKEEE